MNDDSSGATPARLVPGEDHPVGARGEGPRRVSRRRHLDQDDPPRATNANQGLPVGIGLGEQADYADPVRQLRQPVLLRLIVADPDPEIRTQGGGSADHPVGGRSVDPLQVDQP